MIHESTEDSAGGGWSEATLPGGQSRVTAEDLREYDEALAQSGHKWQAVLFKMSQEIRKLWRERDEARAVAREYHHADCNSWGPCEPVCREIAERYPWIKP